tara:strand:+ start:1501 stop:1668 length:168 start_codon:yes stop_codon:yes gene_type:complete
MDISHSTDSTKDYNQMVKELVKYFVKEYKRKKEKERKRKQNFIDMNSHLKRTWKK